MKNKNEHLIEEYYLRELNPAERASLHELLAGNKALRRRFVETGRDEWLMHDAYHAHAAEIVRFKPRHRKQHRMQAIAAGTTLLLSLGIFFLARNAGFKQLVVTEPKPAAIARVSDIYILEGEAVSVANHGNVRKLKPEDELRDGDQVVVPAGCRLTYRYFNEETRVVISSGSLFKVAQLDHAKHIILRQGKLKASVAQQPAGKPMRIVTRDAEAVVLGTVFEIAADGITRLSVDQGKVRFKPLTGTNSIVVTTGFTAEANSEKINSLPFKTLKFHPTEDRTLNDPGFPDFITVDAERDYFGFLKFDLGQLGGRIEEALLTLRVMDYQKDYGGSGEVRLFRVHPRNPLLGSRVQVAHYSGKVAGGMNLEFKIDPSKLSDGVNALMISLDEGGNDFWFSSSSGAVSPCLELKVIQDQ